MLEHFINEPQILFHQFTVLIVKSFLLLYHVLEAALEEVELNFVLFVYFGVGLLLIGAEYLFEEGGFG